ncbi:carboxypeptidase [Virgibacillus halodenitrificans]|uniref:M14 family zinc carboxypeptidase n=1 Tax=Virgibacillus halodenitrificans TaxID=1482 RepID=UPI00136E3ADC|nr:M14 family zinc carboxypeptidase [Virgibacillus halodenitrificans]MYL45266.1 carboxypeptidase [Virgibacillus halodenitrificans]
MRKKLITVALTGTMILGTTLISSPPIHAVGNGPNYGGNESVQTSIYTSHAEMGKFLKEQEMKQDNMELEVIGQSVKGRDLYLVKYITNPDNPTILYLTQQHGNEALNTEGALTFIKEMGTGKMKELADGVNILIVPRLNPDGAAGDVNFSLDDYVADGDHHLTRYNANGVDLNRDHINREQPETKALHENVLDKYDIDYMIDLHHQGAHSEQNGELVSGSILHPTTENVDTDVLQKSKQLGAVVYDAIEPKGWGHLGKYAGGSAETISRNGLAVEYGISTLLFEVRGMADHSYESYVLGQKGNGYLIKQAFTTMESTAKAIADGSINEKDVSFWDTLEVQNTRPTE